MTHAGAGLAIRLFATLERLGVRFSNAYPPQSERLDLLRSEMLGHCPTQQYFHEVATVMNAYQDLMDDVERELGWTPAPAAAERVLVRLIAQLEEVGRGNVPLAELVKDFRGMAQRVPRATLSEAAATLFSYYTWFEAEDGYLEPNLRIAMAAAMIALIEKLPGDLQSVFPQGWRTVFTR
jgi:hypothetical protein